MTLVLRVQDSEGRGPYRPGWSHHWTDLDHSDRNPSFMEEFPRLRFERRPPVGSAYGCGFLAKEQACRWFSAEERSKLTAFGYRLVILNVDEILAISDRQLVFWRSAPLNVDARRIDWDEPMKHEAAWT